MSEKNIYREK